jgi:hypothetical protein
MNCGHEAELPIMGLAMAQIDTGIVFDIGKHAMPRIIQCRKCRKRYGDSTVPEEVADVR